MPTGPTPLTNKAQSNVPFPWAEVLEDPSRADVNFGMMDSGRATWPITIDFKDPATFASRLQTLLGYSKRTGNVLRRWLPMQHPIFATMFLKTVSGLSLRGYTGNQQAPAGLVAGWTRAHLVGSFWAPPFRMMQDNLIDAGVLSERVRFVEWKNKTLTKMLSSDKQAYLFYNVPAGYPTIINQGVPINITEESVEYIWYQVPREWIFGTAGGRRAVNIMKSVGTVNLTAFDGYNPGTLLMEQPDIKAWVPPVPSGVWNLFLGIDPPLMYTVILPFKVFDPPLDPTVTGASAPSSSGGNPLLQGHNTRINPKSPLGLAYPIYTQNGAQPPYQPTEFANIFTAV